MVPTPRIAVATVGGTSVSRCSGTIVVVAVPGPQPEHVAAAAARSGTDRPGDTIPSKAETGIGVIGNKTLAQVDKGLDWEAGTAASLLARGEKSASINRHPSRAHLMESLGEIAAWAEQVRESASVEPPPASLLKLYDGPVFQADRHISISARAVRCGGIPDPWVAVPVSPSTTAVVVWPSA